MEAMAPINAARIRVRVSVLADTDTSVHHFLKQSNTWIR
jgi:hypothetical protein